MIYLLVTIALHPYLFVCFKLFEKFKIDTFQAIVVNYCVCVATGLLNTRLDNQVVTLDPTASWFYYAMFLGLIFIGTFYIIALSAQKVGISVTAVQSVKVPAACTSSALLNVNTIHKPTRIINTAL